MAKTTVTSGGFISISGSLPVDFVLITSRAIRVAATPKTQAKHKISNSETCCFFCILTFAVFARVRHN
jgi:hypothetical protein